VDALGIDFIELGLLLGLFQFPGILMSFPAG